MSPVDDLREAARLLRERAREATVGPWTPADDGLVWAGPPGDPVCGAAQQDDAEYIASMHPLVGLTLAAWFDELAQRAEDMGSGESCGVWPDGTNHTVAIARAYLGRPE